MSELDATKLKVLAPKSRTTVVPNGVDTEYFIAHSSQPLPGRIVFVGPTYVFPNREAIDYFLLDIWPRVRAVEPAASLELIGRCSEGDRVRYERHTGVTCAGYLAGIRPHVAKACCFVVPIRVGGGTRLKILDAWAMGKAVVSTPIGCEGLNAADGENILIRDTPEGFTEGILQVLFDRKLRSRLGANGRQTAEKIYSWNVVGSNMRKQYRRLLESDHKGTPVEI